MKNKKIKKPSKLTHAELAMKAKNSGSKVKRTKLSIEKDKTVKALHGGKRESADGNIYYENRPNRSDVNRTTKLEVGGKVKRTKLAIQKDKFVKALHGGKRESSDGNVYYENRANRSDVNRTTKLEKGGKLGEDGLLKPLPPSEGDTKRKAKRTGYRFKTNIPTLKNKNGELNKMGKILRFKKPTHEEIEKYKRHPDGSFDNKVKQIYHERRADRKHSDDNLTKKYEQGGDFESTISLADAEILLGRKISLWNDTFIIIGNNFYERPYLQNFYKKI